MLWKLLRWSFKAFAAATSSPSFPRPSAESKSENWVDFVNSNYNWLKEEEAQTCPSFSFFSFPFISQCILRFQLAHLRLSYLFTIFFILLTFKSTFRLFISFPLSSLRVALQSKKTDEVRVECSPSSGSVVEGEQNDGESMNESEKNMKNSM